MFSRHPFGFEYGTYLLACVFCVPLVNDVAGRGEVVVYRLSLSTWSLIAINLTFASGKVISV